jgi:malate dehydrogenase (oxaloacetate-decarboxylating)
MVRAGAEIAPAAVLAARSASANGDFDASVVKYPGAVSNGVVGSSRERSSAARTQQVVINDAEIFAAHEGGKLSVALKVPLDTQRALSIAYTPGVAQVSRAIATDRTLAAKYTWANRLVAVISDGSAVLGLGDIGAAASLPVMEGKSALFKTFGGLDSIPIVLATNDPDEIVETIVRLRPTFGAVNLEDISAPRCFEIERRVIEALDCPVMHDDQHGTAIVVLAALLGASKVLDRDMHTLKIVISGAGAAGIACANILLAKGISDITVLDSKGIVHAGRDDMNPFKEELATRTNPRGLSGGLAEALSGADVFLGVSAGLVPEELIATMTPGGIVFAMSNPDPEIHPDAARKYAAVVATGRSDFPNQINNVLAFPGVFRGALDAGARRITERMKVAAAEAIFSVVGDDLAVDHIVPSALDPRVGPAVAAAVAAASGV